MPAAIRTSCICSSLISSRPSNSIDDMVGLSINVRISVLFFLSITISSKKPVLKRILIISVVLLI